MQLEKSDIHSVFIYMYVCTRIYTGAHVAREAAQSGNAARKVGRSENTCTACAWRQRTPYPRTRERAKTFWRLFPRTGVVSAFLSVCLSVSASASASVCLRLRLRLCRCVCVSASVSASASASASASVYLFRPNCDVSMAPCVHRCYMCWCVCTERESMCVCVYRSQGEREGERTRACV
jgi:hypothetical protein